MAASEAQLKANKKYQKKFDRVQIRVTHEEKIIIDQHAEAMGESTNAFVYRAIAETMVRDQSQLKQHSVIARKQNTVLLLFIPLMETVEIVVGKKRYPVGWYEIIGYCMPAY